jgi:GT2 family glycosyltransferase
MIIEFIIPTFDRVKELCSMLASLIAQTDIHWAANVVIDNPTDVKNVRLIKNLNDPRIRSTLMDKRYNDWGHTPRETGKQLSKADYVIMTGDDNYYIPTLIAEINNVAKSLPGMIYWDMVHSHYNYQYFKCAPHTHQIDMGAFATRTDLAKQIHLNPKSFAADGDFIEEFKIKFPSEKIVKIEKVLFVHN